MKGLLLVSVPPGVLTVTYPVVAPGGTVALMYVSETTLNAAGTPFRATLVVPVKPCPRMQPVCPAWPAGMTNETKEPRSILRLNTVPQPSWKRGQSGSPPSWVRP